MAADRGPKWTRPVPAPIDTPPANRPTRVAHPAPKGPVPPVPRGPLNPAKEKPLDG
jgi:hypothetical protein